MAKRATSKGRFLLPKLAKSGGGITYDREKIVSEATNFYKNLYKDAREGNRGMRTKLAREEVRQ